MATAKKTNTRVQPLPDECWLSVLSYLEASELSGCASVLCTGLLSLSRQQQLWIPLLYVDFCVSFAQRALLRTWLAMHQHFPAWQLYVYKRREHILDLDVARTEQQQRGKQALEQDRKQKQVRVLNFCFVRLMHLLLSSCLLASSVLLWLRLNGVIHWHYYVIFAPIFAFEVFVLLSAFVVFGIYFLRSSSGWTFYWNRLRGALRWLILHTSPGESALVLVLVSSIVPLLAFSLEGSSMLPRWLPRFALPFVAFWLASLCLACSLLRRRSFSVGCASSLALLWVPTVLLSVLLFLKLSVFPSIPPYAIFAPGLVVTCFLLLFVGFLAIASFWLGYRGNRDWTEYAIVTLLALLTVLLPLLLFQLALLWYMNGTVSTNVVFFPWVTWLLGLVASAAWHIFMPLTTTSGVPPLDHLMRSWRPAQDLDTQSDMELLLAPAGFV